MKSSLALLLVLAAIPVVPGEVAGPGGQAPASLAATLGRLDTEVFDAFNRCSDPAQLARHAGFFSPNVEFYHDTGGVTWTRDAMIANTAKNACGNYRRELVAGSLRVYPVKEFGAITQGVHRFCQASNGSCEGEAEFVMVWQKEDERWQITRALSYGHRPAIADGNPSQDIALRTRLDALLPPLLTRTKVPSVSIARIQGGRISLLAAYGVQGEGRPATTDTLYNIASMAKPISAEVVLRLVAQQRLALDSPMSPQWIDPDLIADPRHLQLTPRIALSHRTGFANWRAETGGVLRFRHAPGETFGYSGEGFEYLARFTERQTGQDFESLAQMLVFDPSGMKSTAYTGRPWFADRIAQPVDREGKALQPRIAAKFIASDDVYSTPGDYARFMLGLIARQGMDDALATERARIQVNRKAELCPPGRVQDCPLDVGFGLGWEVFRFAENTYLMHTGMDDGSFALGYFNPATGSGTIIFTSSQNGPQLVLPILDTIGADPEFVRFLRSMSG